jgi:hypothetical protein
VRNFVNIAPCWLGECERGVSFRVNSWYIYRRSATQGQREGPKAWVGFSMWVDGWVGGREGGRDWLIGWLIDRLTE